MKSTIATLASVMFLASCAGGGGGGGAAAPPPGTPDPTAPAISTPSAVPSQPDATGTRDRAASVARLIEQQRERAGAPGMIALVHLDGAETWVADGAATLDGAPLRESSRFRIGSITKPIVAGLVLEQVEAGLFALDDEVEALLPGVLRAEPQVTVRQLLDHTSGVFDEGNEGDPEADIENIADEHLRAEARDMLSRYRAGEHVVLPDRIWIALAETHDRYFTPGTDHHYGNVNYQILGMILEHQTGKPLNELLVSAFIEPLGLTGTSLAPFDRDIPDMHGYDTTREAGRLMDVSADITWLGNGAHGGIVSTADELLAMLNLLVTGGFLGPELTEAMKTPAYPSYGLGLATYSLSCGTFLGHGGSVLGTQSIALVSEEGSDGVVVALNIVSDRDPGLPAVADQLVCPIGE